ncbi:Acetyl-CoA:oxalate CoA-transferase [Methylobacterium crusticola]|uniref:Acetyl-CoA:oxalate CoA-transferase n=1 Tax=Methylobacterium crusticola TaxID=1697972 RepID=A0ABQ4R383_9HYPH|nr:CoA transferase [Methylobacterium crusticola]GJD52133.1 Acetyl-CoA:oxalate CoA-transferase [Methylobacterium crusticola]
MSLLDGLRVLTFEQFGAGPYGSMFLADLGAEVIKVENAATGGDASRHMGPHLLGENDSQYFQTFNLNKKSVALDVKTPEGRAALLRLAGSADAVLNNLRGDQPEKLGIDYAGLRAANPRIVCLHISAYGRDNGRKSWPGYDFLMQAEAGLMSLTGEPDGPPSRMGVSMIDFMTGMTGVTGLLAAVIRARATGQGCDVDTSLFDVALHQLTYPGTWHLNEGEVASRLPRGAHLARTPVQTLRTADGWIFVGCMMDKFWDALLDGLGRPDLAADPRFATAAARRDHRDALTALLDEAFAAKPTAAWLAILAGRLPVAPVHDVAQALANPFVAEVGMIARVPHPARPDLRLLANPLKIDGRRPGQAACSALGADGGLLAEAAPAAAPAPAPAPAPAERVA